MKNRINFQFARITAIAALSMFIVSCSDSDQKSVATEPTPKAVITKPEVAVATTNQCSNISDNGAVDGSSFWNSSGHDSAVGINCALDQFMLNNFLYLAGDDGGGHPRFMSYTPWYNLLPSTGSPVESTSYTQLNSTLMNDANQEQAGDSFKLLDTNNAITSYDLRVNKSFFDYVNENKMYTETNFKAAQVSYAANNATGGIWLPPTSVSDTGTGAVEIKTSWRNFGLVTAALCPDDIMHCEIDEDGNSWGLVGMHLVQKTIHQGQFIWATFEHVANAPDCSSGNSDPIGLEPNDPVNAGETINVNKNIATLKDDTGWNYFNYTSYKTAGGDGNSCSFPGSGEETSLCLTTPEGANAGDWDQVNVCRTQALPVATDTACAAANSDPTNLVTVACLNDSVLNSFPSALASKWKYYELAGMEWLVSGATGSSGAPLTGCFNFENSATCVSPAKAGVSETQSYARAGNTELANTTMETWMQDQVSLVSKRAGTVGAADCLDCHQPGTTSYQGDMSHIFDRISQP